MANRPLMKKSAPLPYPICTLAFGCAPTGEHGQRQVEAAPEKVNRTAFADKTRAELVHHNVAGDQDSPPAVGVIAVVGRVPIILFERYRVGDLLGPGVDLDFNAQRSQGRHQPCVEGGDGLWREWKRFGIGAGLNRELVFEEIELDFEQAAAVGDG